MTMLDELNDKQLEAVTSTEGFVRIIAGAGSGKTKALTHRYAYLVRDAGIHPGNVLCVTFTNKAAGEMKRRVRKLAGEGMDTSLITTYHGFCVRVLREDIGRLFFPDNFQILDVQDQKQILEEIYARLEIKLDHASFEKIIDMINELKSKTDYVDYLTSRSEIPANAESLDRQIIQMYLIHQRKIFGLDFNDLINFVFVLFQRSPEVRQKWQERLHYIQVDEFQDSSDRELRLINMLADVNRNLFVVGDPDQNIYEWRGAKVGILVDFDKTHENTNTIIMNQNYRSTANILGAANTLIDNNRNRIKKDLFTLGETGETVTHYHAKTEAEECSWVVNKIKALKKEKFDYNGMAVLYRASFLSRAIEQTLMSENIPYEIVGSTRFYDRMEIMDTLAYLKIIAYDDDKALLRIINTPRRTFGKAKITLLKNLAEGAGLSLYKTLLVHRTHPEWRNSAIEYFVDMIEDMRGNYKSRTLSEIVNDVLHKSGYESYIRESGNMDRFENLGEFKKIAVEMERNFGEFLSLEEFLGQVSLMSDREKDEDADTVKLMTIHAAKGLEFPAVFVIGMSEGIFPSSRTLEERRQAGLEEERRLCFVALTRAMKRLYLTDSEGTNQNGQKKTPSRFLFEIGEQYITRIGDIPKDVAENTKPVVSAPTQSHQKGDTVEHKIFGSGEIVDINDKTGTYMIKFDKTNSIKPISADYNFTNVGDDGNRPVETKSDVTDPRADYHPPLQTKPPTPIKDETDDNLWNDPTVPHDGWHCSSIVDLGAPEGICKMCGHQIIRYVHLMVHPNYPRKIGAGCVCAGNMEGNPDAAKTRESEFKKRQARLATFMSRKRMRSKNGNEYIKYKNEVIVILGDKFKPGNYKTAVRGSFSASHETVEDALKEAFDMLDPP